MNRNWVRARIRYRKQVAVITPIAVLAMCLVSAVATGEQQPTQLLDAPLLFVKRHSYTGIHIYDTYYKWPPGGGGIYVLENPAASRSQWRIRAVIDPDTPNTLGFGVYSHPELSWDAKKLLFCFKGKPDGNTSIYEINVDGQNLRQVTDPSPTCATYKGSHSGQHDISPAYLPDGRIVFLSTRQSGLVPCNNTGVGILHVMNADGSDIHPISVNFVNEFDPVVLPDGRILFGRWEYVDKNALTIQSLWSINPDGTRETAVFANNLVFPEAILDARPVAGSPLIMGTLAKHNGPPRGSIAFIDSRLGKNNIQAITNLEHPNQPTFDRGNSCEPWPLSEDTVIFSGRPAHAKRNVLELINRKGIRFTLLADSDICLHSPMLIKPRPVPPVIPRTLDRTARTGRFLLQDIYQGLEGVRRGEIKWLRVIEEMSRVSPSTMGGSPYNQTFLVSAALAFSAKNYLGVVPVSEDGSAYFEAPAGRALYFKAVDGGGRLVQSMRSFVQAAPGTTRACIGCHEHRSTAPPDGFGTPISIAREPTRLQPESWGGGYLDYPTMVQPVLDRHCVRCHGGEKGIAAGIDLTGGWTEYFSISYENLVSRSESQLVAHWIAGIDCMNGTAFWSSQIFQPRTHGSGAAPLASLLVDGHGGRVRDMTRTERDLMLAWIDSNGLYHGTWDSTDAGCAIKEWKPARKALVTEMGKAGCLRCHGDDTGKIQFFEEDWINLQQPELSRLLRAPLPPGQEGHGLGLCRDHRVDSRRQRIRQLVNGYAHAVQPIKAFARRELPSPDTSGASIISFGSIHDKAYQAMFAIIRRTRDQALAHPRVDMPGARIVPGQSRQGSALEFPDMLPVLHADPRPDGSVMLSWDHRADLAGMIFELHRGATPEFVPEDTPRIASTTLYDFVDPHVPLEARHYALVIVIDQSRSEPVRASLARRRFTH